jgi:2,3-bisphosphoglycerate-dependent phosphoglycerate mutase
MTLIDDLREHLIVREIREDFFEIWRKSWNDFDFVVDGGESSRQCQRRIVPAITEIVRNSDASEVAIVSHGNAIGLFLHFLASDFGYTDAEQIRNPDIFQIEFKDDTFHWKREFSPDPLDKFASSFRETPIDE